MTTRALTTSLMFGLLVSPLAAARAENWPPAVREPLERAGKNRSEIEAALERVPESQRNGMLFLVEHMPEPDLATLSAEFLLENVEYAYRAWNEAPWKDSIPEAIFLKDVLPYASVDESRDRWRKDFYERFRPLIAEAKTPGRAAVLLNQKTFQALHVRYSTKRRWANQGPYQTIETGLASCTGLSILLIDACRAVGVPARFVGIPRWTDKSGNHSWVEVWDDGWHFTGAAEPTGDDLDRAWFAARASQAQRDEPRHAIYAVSYRRTPLRFPLVWNRRIDWVRAVNVTDHYAGRSEPLPEGFVRVFLRTTQGVDRCTARVEIRDPAGEVVFEGETKDERFDSNDHTTAALRRGQTYEVEVSADGRKVTTKIEVSRDEQLVTLAIPRGDAAAATAPSPSAVNASASSRAVASLGNFLETPRENRPPVASQPFAAVPLTRSDADRAQELLWKDHSDWVRASRAAEMEARVIRDGELEMPFFYRIFGEKPAGGRSLYISLHGGGGAPARVNDRQWENQKRLYTPEEGVYLVPRAPTNTWNLWHQPHIDEMFDRLIENLIVLEDVNPDRVYVHGYSAGGDGVYQLAPRMADRFGAAAMMAGHPNETVPLGLRNLPFTIHVGGKDAAYNRNKVAREWSEKLDALARSGPDAYVHWVKIYPEKSHWMDREDAAALPWMAKHQRKPFPERVVWKQDDVTHDRFYWLAVGEGEGKPRALVVAARKGQRIDVESGDVERVVVRLNDDMVELDRPVTITSGERVLFEGRASRTIAVMARTLAERGDPRSIYRAGVAVKLAPEARIRSF